MGERLHKTAAGAAVMLGTAHLIYGIFVFKALAPRSYLVRRCGRGHDLCRLDKL